MRTRSKILRVLPWAVPFLLLTATAIAQLVDKTLAPNAANEGINKSYTQEIGAGLADSCASCHGRPRGSAGFGGDVATRPDSRDSTHLFGLGLKEMLADEITHDLRDIRTQAITEAQTSGKSVTKELVSKSIHYGFITANPDGSVDTTKVEGVNADLRIRPFFGEGKTISIREFVAGALQAEMGMQAVDPDLANAANNHQTITTPSGMVLDGTADQIEAPPTADPNADLDNDGVINEVPESIVDYLEIYLLNYFKPGTLKQTQTVEKGRKVFEAIGCASCHIPDLMINHDRRVGDVDTEYDPVNGVFNRLFATAKTLNDNIDDGSGYPSLKPPLGGSFLVKDIYTDFKRHDVGSNFYERNYDGSMQQKFMTRPLWGVGSTPPYGHDGRSINLTEVILRHDGEAKAAKDQFKSLSRNQRTAVLEFLESLILFPPDDTASNLNPADPTVAGFPQFGHGSIKITVLFNDPSDLE